MTDQNWIHAKFEIMQYLSQNKYMVSNRYLGKAVKECTNVNGNLLCNSGSSFSLAKSNEKCGVKS